MPITCWNCQPIHISIRFSKKKIFCQNPKFICLSHLTFRAHSFDPRQQLDLHSFWLCTQPPILKFQTPLPSSGTPFQPKISKINPREKAVMQTILFLMHLLQWMKLIMLSNVNHDPTIQHDAWCKKKSTWCRGNQVVDKQELENTASGLNWGDSKLWYDEN